MSFVVGVFEQALQLLLESSVYIVFGILISGLLRVFMNPSAVARHLGQGRVKSVFKAAVLGIPAPLCSCGVLPAAIALKKQGANNGATASFLISTPESGIDSLAVSYAMLDPLMTVARPVAAFTTAVLAGIAENLSFRADRATSLRPDLTCPVDACCNGEDCPPEDHARHHSLREKAQAGLGNAFGEIWADIACWFFIGLLLAGLITTVLPADLFRLYLGGGVIAMLLMLAAGIPMYICATASTPVAAALILKGVSPGAALVFLLAGPATNITSLTVLTGLLGKRATAIYLAAIAICAVFFGLAVDQIYALFSLSPQALMGRAGELTPLWLQWAAACFLLVLSVKPVSRAAAARFNGLRRRLRAPGEEKDSGGGPCRSPT